MKKRELTTGYLSALCLELALLQKAGVSTGDGLLMLSEDEQGRSRDLLEQLHRAVEGGASLSDALTDAGCFPEYLLQMTRLGETAGRLEETMLALSEYYDRQGRLRAGVRSAVLYPLILLAIMLAVVVVLITQVLPIFNEVFAQLGAQMSPFATRLMALGEALSRASTVIVIVVAALAAVCLVVVCIPPLKRRALAVWNRAFGGAGLGGKLAGVRFASAMAIAMASGLDAERAVDMAGQVAGGSRQVDEKLARCRALLGGGARLEEALAQSKIFTSRDSRMLSLGVKTGSGDTVMREIARRSEADVEDELDARLSKIEPTLVILIAVMVGGILLSVMLPLMGIMTAIG